MLWAPVIQGGKQLSEVEEVEATFRERHRKKLRVIANRTYLKKLIDLRKTAQNLPGSTPHAVLRYLQIEARLREHVGRRRRKPASDKAGVDTV